MRRQSLYPYIFLVLILASTMAPGMAKGQGPQFFPPHELYKFHMGSTNGYFYTPWYSQGAAYYSYQGPIGSGPSTGTTAGIYPNPQQGYTPVPAAGLLPLYQWTVIEGFRSYLYLSIYNYGNPGSNYHFNGIAGYVYPPSTTFDPLFGMPTVKVSAWYSQSRGYWYGINEPADGIYEHPPSGWGYQFHGVPFRMPAPPTAATGPGRCGSSFPYISCDGSRTVRYDTQQCYDPVGEQNCDSAGGQWNPSTCTCLTCNSWEEQVCNNRGGQWDPSTCTCSYDCNPRFENCGFLPY